MNLTLINIRSLSKEGDSNDIFLTEEEISKIYALELSGKEEQVRDLFVLQC